MALRERKSLFWIFALLLLIIAPFVILLTPVIISVTLFSGKGTIVFVPFTTSMWMFFFAFLFVIVLLCASYFSRSVALNVITGIIGTAGFLFIFILGAQNYVYLHEDKIEHNPLWGTKVVHQWEELAKVTHEMYDQETKRDEKYIFEFTDGYTFEFLVSGVVDGTVKSTIYNKAVKRSIPFEEY